MINELYQLTKALDQANIAVEHTHPKYKLIPKVTKKAPCVHIILENGQIEYRQKSYSGAGGRNQKVWNKSGRVPGLEHRPIIPIDGRIGEKENFGTDGWETGKI